MRTVLVIVAAGCFLLAAGLVVFGAGAAGGIAGIAAQAVAPLAFGYAFAAAAVGVFWLFLATALRLLENIANTNAALLSAISGGNTEA